MIELTSVRAINKAAREYAAGREAKHPVYAQAHSGTVRVLSARSTKGILWVKSTDNCWYIPLKVWKE
jgi:hypothetical protein